jgi:tyrosinase
MSGTTTPPVAPPSLPTYHRRSGRSRSHAISFSRDSLQRKDFQRADLVFEGVDHAGPSFEARVFLNNPNATENTPRQPAEGYAGSFHIFGHGSCFGDAGHCDVNDRGMAGHDLRGQHPLTPARKILVVTDALKQVLDRDGKLDQVTVVPVAYGHAATGDTDPQGFLKYDTVHLATYD